MKFEYSGEQMYPFVQKVEVAIIRDALKKSKGNITYAANALGVLRTTLIGKMKKYMVKASDYRRANLSVLTDKKQTVL